MFEDLLIHTVHVYARKQLTDRFGQPVGVNPQQTTGSTFVASYPCRVYMKAGGLTMLERSIDVFERMYAMYLDLDAEIFEDDSVRVVDQNGTEIFSLGKVKDSEIKYDGTGPHHQEFTVWIQSGPTPGRPS